MFSEESKLFGKASKLGNGKGNSQYPGQEVGDIPNWKEGYEYDLDREIMSSDGVYYRCIVNHVSTGNFSNDLLNGYWVPMVVIPPSSSSVNYSNVLFVDPVFGNNATALAGRFDKPYQTISQATTIAASMGGSLSQRILIYIRKGTYATNVNLTNWVDFYCEPGVVFQGGGSIRDFGTAVISNFYGYAKFVAKTALVMHIQGSSTVNFQFDYIDNSSNSCLRFEPPIGGQCDVQVEGNKIFGTTNGVGYAIAIRRKANVTMNIKSWVRAYHSIFDIRDNYDGQLVVTCPRIILDAGNLYGGNFKQAVICYSSTANARMIFNADFINEMPAFAGGIAGMITNWSATNGIIEVNGDVYGGETYGIYASGNQVPGRIAVTGNVFSNIQPIWVSSNNSCYVRQGVVSKPSVIAGSPIAMNQSAKLFLDDVKIYNAQVDGDLINVIDSTNEVNLYNVIGQSEGLLGLAVTSANPVTIKSHGSRFNKPLGGTITDALVPSGFINDPLVVVPKF